MHGPSPSCGVAGTKAVHGRPGLNRVRLTGRFNGRPLAPGTYRIDVIARRATGDKRVGRISVQVVPPGTRLHRSSAPPAFYCVSSRLLPAFAAALTGTGGAGGVLAERSSGGHAPAAKVTTHHSGAFPVPRIHLGGAGDSVWDLVFDLLAYAILAGVGGAAVVHAAKHLRNTRSP